MKKRQMKFFSELWSKKWRNMWFHYRPHLHCFFASSDHEQGLSFYRILMYPLNNSLKHCGHEIQRQRWSPYRPHIARIQLECFWAFYISTPQNWWKSNTHWVFWCPHMWISLPMSSATNLGHGPRFGSTSKWGTIEQCTDLGGSMKAQGSSISSALWYQWCKHLASMPFLSQNFSAHPPHFFCEFTSSCDPQHNPVKWVGIWVCWPSPPWPPASPKTRN